MKTVKIKFVGKSAGLRPEDNLVCYYLQKNGYEVVLSEEPDYVICDVFGNPPYAYCRYPQIRIFESGENYTPDFNVMDYAICRYPISFSDRCFYLPGCTNPGDHWHALAKMDRSRYDLEFLRAKPYFANFISGHDSEHNIRGDFFRKLNQYKRVEAAGTLYNNMPGGQTVDWLDGSKTELQRKSKFTICFESTCHYGFITEKITDAFYADTIPIYYGSPNITEIFNKNAFINCTDYPSFDAVIEKIKELDQDDEKYLEMLRQPILVDPTYPERLDKALEQFLLNIFEQPYDQAYRRCRAYYPKNHDDYLANCIEPTKGYLLKQRLKRALSRKEK